MENGELTTAGRRNVTQQQGRQWLPVSLMIPQFVISMAGGFGVQFCRVREAGRLYLAENMIWAILKASGFVRFEFGTGKL